MMFWYQQSTLISVLAASHLHRVACAVASIGSGGECNAAAAVQLGLNDGLSAQESLLHQVGSSTTSNSTLEENMNACVD